MTDLKLIGYSAEHFETSLTVDDDEIDKNVRFHIHLFGRTQALDDHTKGILRVEIKIEGNKGNDIVFAALNCAFNLLFETDSEVDSEQMNALLRSVGIESAIPLIRGIVVGATNMLGLPGFFNFPSIDTSQIEWNAQ